MKTPSCRTTSKQAPFSRRIAVGLSLSILIFAPQALAARHSIIADETLDEARTAPDKPKDNQSKTKSAGQQKPKSNTGENSEDDEEKSATEKLQEGLETAQEAYEKVGTEILEGNYGKALDGAADMAKDKLIETAEDALKKKNENLYKAYKLGKDIKDDMLKGDYAKVWETTKDAAYDEAKEFVEDKIIEKAIPGYGQLKGAWDVGYEVIGPAIGKLPISADGRTVNNLAEDQMTTIFYSGKDNATSKKIADEEVIQAFIKSVKNGDVGLPEGMNFGETTAKIRFNLDYGFPPLDAIELSPGTKERKLLAEQAATQSATPKATPVRVPEPVEDDPWAVDPAPRNATPQVEAAKPQEAPADDIWATDNAGDDSLDEQRYRLQQQLEADKARDRAVSDNQSRRQFAAVEAKREEEARIKAEKAREFQEGLAAIAQGLGQVAQKIQQERNSNSGSQRSVQVGDYSAAIAYDQRVQDCVNSSGRPGFPAIDVYAAQYSCSQKLGPRPQPTFKTEARSTNVNNAKPSGSPWGSSTPNYDGLNVASGSSGARADSGSGDAWGTASPPLSICGVEIGPGGWTTEPDSNSRKIIVNRSRQNTAGVYHRKEFSQNCALLSEILPLPDGGKHRKSYCGAASGSSNYLCSENITSGQQNTPMLSKNFGQDGKLQNSIIRTSNGQVLHKDFGLFANEKLTEDWSSSSKTIWLKKFDRDGAPSTTKERINGSGALVTTYSSSRSGAAYISRKNYYERWDEKGSSYRVIIYNENGSVRSDKRLKNGAAIN